MSLLPNTKPVGTTNEKDFGLSAFKRLLKKRVVPKSSASEHARLSCAVDSCIADILTATADEDEVQLRRDLRHELKESEELQSLLQEGNEFIDNLYNARNRRTNASYDDRIQHDFPQQITFFKTMTGYLVKLRSAVQKLPAWKSTCGNVEGLDELIINNQELIAEVEHPQSIIADIRVKYGSVIVESDGGSYREDRDEFIVRVAGKDGKTRTTGAPFSQDKGNNFRRTKEGNAEIGLNSVWCALKSQLPQRLQDTWFLGYSDLHIHVEFSEADIQNGHGYITFLGSWARTLGNIWHHLLRTDIFDLTKAAWSVPPKESIDTKNKGEKMSHGSPLNMDCAFLFSVGRYSAFYNSVSREHERTLNTFLKIHSLIASVNGFNEFYKDRDTEAEFDGFTLEDFVEPNISCRIESPIPNDFNYKKGRSVYLITGPNAHGKTTFLNGIALNAYLNQCGLPVFADNASLPLFDNIFVFAPQAHEVGTSHHEIECKVVDKHFNYITPNSLLVFDDYGAGTSPEDGLEFLEGLMHGFGERIPYVFVSTHFHELVERNRHPYIENMRVLVDEENPMHPTHKIVPGIEPRSLGIELAGKYGVTYDQIKERLRKNSVGPDLSVLSDKSA